MIECRNCGLPHKETVAKDLGYCLRCGNNLDLVDGSSTLIEQKVIG